MSKWSMMAYGSIGTGWCARKINDDSIATDGLIFYGDNAKERCESFVKAANENPSGSLCIFPVPATGKWEKEFEWTGEVRQLKAEDWYINGTGSAAFATWNATTFTPSFYILKKKKLNWEVGKLYWAKNRMCFYIRNINNAWLTDDGMRAMHVVDDVMSYDEVTDQEVWDIISRVKDARYSLVSNMIKTLRENFKTFAQ